MKNPKATLYFIAIILLFASCKKEEDKTVAPTPSQGNDSTIFSKWQRLSGGTYTSDGEIKYLYLNIDSSTSALWEDTVGFRSIGHSHAVITSNRINVLGSVFDYLLVSKDTLELSNSMDTLYFLKNTNAPSENSFVIPVKPILYMDLSSYVSGYLHDLAWNGNRLIFYSASSSALMTINTSNLSVDNLLLITHSNIRGLAWHAGNLWVNDNNSSRLYKLDSNGNDLDTSSSYTGYPDALASDGQFIWSLNGNGMYRYDPSIDTSGFMPLWPMTPRTFDAMEIKNGFLYLCDYDMIYKCNINPFKVLTNYQFDYGVDGIVSDGSFFWLSDNYRQLYKVNLQ